MLNALGLFSLFVSKKKADMTEMLQKNSFQGAGWGVVAENL